ncbi:MerR family transcriptional regulator [Lactococcus lactis]|nr:MerR family transcriptional regulator [Lactococcus lactis]
MRELISSPVWVNHYNYLLKRRDEISHAQEKLNNSFNSTDDWIEIIREGEMVLQNRDDQVISMKYYPISSNYCFLTQQYHYNFKESIINLDWMRYLEKQQLEIAGPVILKYDSYSEKMEGKCKYSTILQHCLQPQARLIDFGGFMALNSYHIGALDNIAETYQKIINYAEVHKFIIGKECYERHVIDYWTTQNSNEFVTEVIIPIVAKGEIVCKN